jgi:hypothetical protein
VHHQITQITQIRINHPKPLRWPFGPIPAGQGPNRSIIRPKPGQEQDWPGQVLKPVIPGSQAQDGSNGHIVDWTRMGPPPGPPPRGGSQGHIVDWTPMGPPLGGLPGPYCRLDPYGTPWEASQGHIVDWTPMGPPLGGPPRAILSIGPLGDPPWEGLPGPYCRLDPYGTPPGRASQGHYRAICR